MNQITEIITGSVMSILVILAGIVVQAVKKYLIAKGGEKAVLITEILAKNAVKQLNRLPMKLAIKEPTNWHQRRLRF